MEMEREAKVMVFFGADRKTGTTMIAQSMMEKIAENGKSSALFMLHPRPGRTFLPAGGVGIDAIRTQLASGLLTKEELLQAGLKMKAGFVLPGPDDVLAIRHWHPEHIRILVKLAHALFDVVLFDAGGGTDVLSGLSVAALEEETDQRFLITTPQEEPFEQWMRLRPVMERMQGFQLVVNREGAASGLPSPREVAERYGCPLAGALPDLGIGGWQAEIDRRTLLPEEAFQIGMMKVMKHAGFEMSTERRRTFWPWQRRKRA